MTMFKQTKVLHSSNTFILDKVWYVTVVTNCRF